MNSRIILGVGHSGTSVLARIHWKAGWHFDGSQRSYAHFVEPAWCVPYTGMITRHNRGSPRDDDLSIAQAAQRVVDGFAASKRPTVVKDPRFVVALPHLAGLLSVEPQCELLMIRRSFEQLTPCYLRRNQRVAGQPGVYGLTLPVLCKLAEQAYEQWPGTKWAVEYDRLCELINQPEPSSYLSVAGTLRIPERKAEMCRLWRARL